MRKKTVINFLLIRKPGEVQVEYGNWADLAIFLFFSGDFANTFLNCSVILRRLIMQRFPDVGFFISVQLIVICQAQLIRNWKIMV